jgi:hypothetical protein
MRNRLSTSRSSLGRRRRFVAVGVAALLSVGAATAAVALAGHSPTVHFSVLTHHGKGARSASATAFGRLVPRGATLATTNNTDGVASEVYAARLSNGEVCLSVVQLGKGGATACGRPSEVQENGVSVATRAPGNPTSVAVLVPDGTSSATSTDTNGATQVQKVTNNVVTVTSASPASVTYTTPSGATKVFDVPPRPASATSAPSTIVP